MRPGDVLVTNTPWIATGHLNDITVAKPIFRDGRIVAFAASTAHAPDIGGKVRSVEPREVFEEGFHIPVMKLLERGQARRDADSSCCAPPCARPTRPRATCGRRSPGSTCWSGGSAS